MKTIKKDINIVRIGSLPSKKKPGMGLAVYELSKLEKFSTKIYSYKLENNDEYLQEVKSLNSNFIKFENPVMPRKRNGLKFLYLQFKRTFAVISFSINVLKTIRKMDLDIMHVHSPLHFLLLKWANFKGVETFLTFHGTDFKRVKNSKFYSFLLKGTKNINCVSDRHLSELKKIFPDSRLELVSNGVDWDYFHPDGNDHSQDHTIISVGTLRWHKDYETLILAFSHIAKENKKWILKIFGEGEQRNHLQEVINKLRLQERILMPGSVSRVELREELKRAKIFVLSSVTEGLPKVLLEAMSAKCACVVTDVGDCKRILGSSGITVDSRNAISLGLSIEEYIKRPDLQFKDSYLASERASKFSWNAYNELHENIYFSALKKSIKN